MGGQNTVQILSRRIKVRRTGEIRIIHLYPSRAFGNGDHETTASCLRLLEQMDLAGKRILDLGSGNGILSIAAGFLGGEDIVSVDIWSEAAVACRANVRLNGFDHIIRVVTGTIDVFAPDTFDLIMANMHGDILISQAGQIAGKLKNGGHCILSGILYEDHYEVRKSFAEHGGVPGKSIFMNDYTTLFLVKNGDSEKSA